MLFLKVIFSISELYQLFFSIFSFFVDTYSYVACIRKEGAV